MCHHTSPLHLPIGFSARWPRARASAWSRDWQPLGFNSGAYGLMRDRLTGWLSGCGDAFFFPFPCDHNRCQMVPRLVTGYEKMIDSFFPFFSVLSRLGLRSFSQFVVPRVFWVPCFRMAVLFSCCMLSLSPVKRLLSFVLFFTSWYFRRCRLCFVLHAPPVGY